ncbi:MAG: tRNA (adenosine(37)-N6)-dimethylallyltransferase MiaA [Bacteroidales bacterium]|nr:tRNA (adenosine(37)-N6)-dimethylallyltransferase MiaA [Bacteroidales bacterium]
MNNFLIVLLGPTGVGKTDVSIKLATHFGTDIISADSRQFYREMRIGTAVPSEDQLKKVNHHFVRFISVYEYYSVSRYETDVLRLLPELFSANRIALMTGGSGLYIDAVCRGIDDIPDVDPDIREKYQQKFRNEGLESLRIELKMRDPEYYRIVDLRNPKRIIRALEICATTGTTYSSFLTRSRRERDFKIIKTGLTRERNELYEMINNRVDRMISEGLEEEARQLMGMKGLNALNCVGYTELFEYFEGRITREKAIDLIKRNTRRYAKRQMTWWGRDKEITWFHPDQIKEIIEFVERQIG